MEGQRGHRFAGERVSTEQQRGVRSARARAA